MRSPTPRRRSSCPRRRPPRRSRSRRARPSGSPHPTWILDHARGKTLLVNDPRGLRELNEHLAVLQFPHLTPPTIVTRSADKLRAFQREQGGAIVVKPVDGYAGLGIFVVRSEEH